MTVSDICGARHTLYESGRPEFRLTCTLTMWHDGWYHNSGGTTSWGFGRTNRFEHLGTDQLQYMVETLEKALTVSATLDRRKVDRKLIYLRNVLDTR